MTSASDPRDKWRRGVVKERNEARESSDAYNYFRLSLHLGISEEQVEREGDLLLYQQGQVEYENKFSRRGSREPRHFISEESYQALPEPPIPRKKPSIGKTRDRGVIYNLAAPEMWGLTKEYLSRLHQLVLREVSCQAHALDIHPVMLDQMSNSSIIALYAGSELLRVNNRHKRESLGSKFNDLISSIDESAKSHYALRKYHPQILKDNESQRTEKIQGLSSLEDGVRKVFLDSFNREYEDNPTYPTELRSGDSPVSSHSDAIYKCIRDKWEQRQSDIMKQEAK